MRNRGTQPARRVLKPTDFVGEPVVKEVGDDRLHGKVVSYDPILRYWHVRYFDGSTCRLGQKALLLQCSAEVECAYTPTPSKLAIGAFLASREPAEKDWYLREGSLVAPYAQRQWAQLDTGSDFAVSRGKSTGPAEHTLCACGQGCVETVQHAVLECPLYNRVRPPLSSAFAALATAVLAEDSYELAPSEALSWATSNHPPLPVLGGEGGVKCLAALRAALLGFHRAVKSIRYNKGKAAAVQHPETP